MDFEQKKRNNINEKNYHIENLRLAREFSKKLILEMKELVRSIVIFGSNANDTLKKESDIDIAIILDNVSVYVSDELKEAYHIIINNLTENLARNKFHVLTINLSDFWDMARKGDPLYINILRYGVPLFDRDLVTPMQYLLEIGKIRPTVESIYNYSNRAKTLLNESSKHIENAILDLYYSVVDLVHSVLMSKKILPPSPREMPMIFKNEFKGTKNEKDFKIIQKLYDISKDIEYERRKFEGRDYDNLKKEVEKLFVSLNKIIEEELKKKDNFDL
jgi:predicted nucleotidyltransferase/uncharacterized protein (UPF0332 family)